MIKARAVDKNDSLLTANMLFPGAGIHISGLSFYCDMHREMSLSLGRCTEATLKVLD